MEIKNIISAKEAIHKMMPFIRGLSKPPVITEYVEELSKNLEAVSDSANELVNPAAKDLIFQFKDLHGLISSINGKLIEENGRYINKRESPEGLSDWERLRHDFFDAILNPLLKFIEDVKATPWGSFIKYEHLSSPSPLFSSKELWPENLQGIHVCLRTILLERSDIVEPLMKMYGTQKEAQNALADYYGLGFKTIENNFTNAYDLLKASPNDLSSNRKKQLLEVKAWLEKEGYTEESKSIKI